MMTPQPQVRARAPEWQIVEDRGRMIFRAAAFPERAFRFGPCGKRLHDHEGEWCAECSDQS
jgi:hypothetical protein